MIGNVKDTIKYYEQKFEKYYESSVEAKARGNETEYTVYSRLYAMYFNMRTWLQHYSELSEKEIAKVPYTEGDGYDENGNLIYDTWYCPNCNKSYELEYEEYKRCPECGQLIDWAGYYHIEKEDFI